MIYFAQADVIGHIKIGWHAGTNAADRLRELQTGCPTRLILLGTMPGEQETEADLHRRFAFAHVHGEWFRPVPELLAFIGQQPTGLQAGATEAQTRFVQIKILTVDGNRFSQALFDQLPSAEIIDWAVSGPDSPLVEKGDPWGWCKRQSSQGPSWHLVWQQQVSLFRCPLGRPFPYQLTREWSGEEQVNWHLPTLIKAYRAVWEEANRRWDMLDQLFIGVS